MIAVLGAVMEGAGRYDRDSRRDHSGWKAL